MKKKHLIFIFLLFAIKHISAQTIVVKAENVPLNIVLIGIMDKYKLNLSFDDSEFKKYNISVNKQFSSPRVAFKFLIKNTPFEFEKYEQTFLFLPKKNILKQSHNYSLSGRIFDSESMESLPYTHILINNVGTTTDNQGKFNFSSKTDSLFEVKISHLGYRLLDSILIHSINHKIPLKSLYTELSEITINGNSSVVYKQTGEKAGLMHINHAIANLIPGNGDNSVFEVLRLQPGILAAGEQSNDLIIWGSFAGQTKLTFDGISIFGLKNYNDKISVVNPFMAKDIRVHKAGYDAVLGERVGGIVEISGVNSSKEKTNINLSVNNMTMNIMTRIPLNKNNSLIAAFRQTYYNLYKYDDLKFNESSYSHMPNNSIGVSPDYIFRDGNLKFAGNNLKGDSYHISSFWGQDDFSYSINKLASHSNISKSFYEKNKQYGFSAYYNRNIEGRGSLDFNLAYSALKTNIFDGELKYGGYMNHDMGGYDKISKSVIEELQFKMSGKYRILNKHELEFGSGLINNKFLFRDNNKENIDINEKGESNIFLVFLQDKFSVSEQFEFTYGFRNNYSLNLKKNYIQARINLSYSPSEVFQINSSFGKYNQFIGLSSLVDENNNYSFQWMISDEEKIPVLSSTHFVLGGSYNHNGFSSNIEGFFKEINGISRIINDGDLSTYYSGESVSKGIDVFIKKEYKGHSAWISYSLSETLEWFPYFKNNSFKRALHDQRHEVKISGIVNLSPFIVSANYIYGSGFYQNFGINSNIPYKRMDIACLYKGNLKKVKFETGVSILNLFGSENIKYANIKQLNTETNNIFNIYSESVPFTPTVFFNLNF